MKWSICAGVTCRKPRTATGDAKMDEKWIDCLGQNLSTVLFYLCDEAQERLAEKDPDFKKVDADRLMDAIVDKLGDVNVASALYVDTVLGIELEIQLNQEPGLRKILVDVASFDARYGDGAGESAVQKAEEAWLQAHVAENPRLCGGVKRTVVTCLFFLASFAFAETETVDYHTEVVEGIEWTFQIITHNGNRAAFLTAPRTKVYRVIDENVSGEVKIPEFLDEAPVVKIDKMAFNGCMKISRIIIPNSVEEIGEGAFQVCTALSDVQLSEKIEVLPRGCFLATGLKKFRIPDTVRSLGEFLFVETDLHEVVVGKGVTNLCSATFAKKTSFTMSETESVLYSEIKRIFFLGDEPTWTPSSVCCDRYPSTSDYRILENGFGEATTCYYRQGAKGWDYPDSRWHGSLLDCYSLPPTILPDSSTFTSTSLSISYENKSQ